ncbi:MAG: hypothetical protein RO009_07785 [Pseudorhodoplanes sp.]|jgi:hypothetical protein|nr:hypothetical protein [Pseudorhodoplanes sp.]
MSPALIFDELEERPFTENRRWRDSDLKIHTRLQTATDFVGVSSIVTPVCRSGQHAVAKRHDNVLNRRAVFCGLLRQYISLPTLRAASLAGFRVTGGMRIQSPEHALALSCSCFAAFRVQNFK